MSDDKSFASTLETLKKNDPKQVKIVCETLLRILRAVQTCAPGDETSRRIRLESDDVQYNLLPYEGGLEILFDMGFEEVRIILV